MITLLKSLLVVLIEALKTATQTLKSLPLLLIWQSNNKIEALQNEILKLESNPSPDNRARLGQLRLQEANARKFHATLQSRDAALNARDQSADT